MSNRSYHYTVRDEIETVRYMRALHDLPTDLDERCPACEGKGHEIVDCDACYGTGDIATCSWCHARWHGDDLGRCAACHHENPLVTHVPCEKCRGEGDQKETCGVCDESKTIPAYEIPLHPADAYAIETKGRVGP